MISVASRFQGPCQGFYGVLGVFHEDPGSVRSVKNVLKGFKTLLEEFVGRSRELQ